MPEIDARFAAGIAVVGAAVVGFAVRRRSMMRIRERLFESLGQHFGPPLTYRPPKQRALTVIVPLLSGGIAALATYWVTESLAFSCSVFVVSAIAGHVARDAARVRRELGLEERLADALDIVVSALRAGVSLLDALEAATTEAAGELRNWLAELTGRLRLGDRPAEVFPEMAAKLPLESYRLVSFILAVQWDAGGSLAATLAAVARTVRDRLEVVRRVKAQAAEAQFSVIGILLIVYVVAFLLGRAEPERMQGFLSWAPGAAMAVAVILLQAVGLLWIRRLSDIQV